MNTIQGRRREQSGMNGEHAAPGDYWFAGDSGHLWICLPNGEIGMLRRDVHEITEHDDGTVTVRPSILLEGEHHWHGWLERGVWREE